MKLTRALAVIPSLLAVVSACAGPRALIDGTSAESFARSHAGLVASLSPTEHMQLLLAEVVLLESKDCLTEHPANPNSLVERQLGGPVDISPCRKELHGIGFQEIMKRAYPSGGARGSDSLPPNNSSKPTPLRGAA